MTPEQADVIVQALRHGAEVLAYGLGLLIGVLLGDW